MLAAAAALVAGVAVGSGSGGAPSERAAGRPHATLTAAHGLTLRQQVGQLLVSSFDGTVVPAYLRRRLGAAETAGVIAFGRNSGAPVGWRALTGALQRAAHGSALVAVDQEGGSIRTLPFAPPESGQPAQGSPAQVRRLLRRAGLRLRAVGVNVDLAPVADVAVSPAALMGSRAFPGDARAVAARTAAAVAGLRAGHVAATAKHFPGLGAAAVNTDDGPVTITTSRTLLERGDLVPFRAAVRERVPLVMVSHALYPALDARRIASQSPAVVSAFLRRGLGFDGVVVTDSLEAEAVLRRSDVATAAQRSIGAGADLILMTGSASWAQVFPRLLDRARRSPAFRRRVLRSAGRVLALKSSLGLRPPPVR